MFARRVMELMAMNTVVISNDSVGMRKLFQDSIWFAGEEICEEDLEEKCLVLWRIMFPVEYQNKGYGTQAIQQIVQLAKESGKYDFMILDYVPENMIAKHVYEKLGFKPTGEVDNGEIIMKLNFEER